MANRLMASPLRFASFLTDRFADAIISLRRANEKSARAFDEGADFASFGPSSAPPPPSGPVADFAVPKAPALPMDLVVPPPAEPEEEEPLELAKPARASESAGDPSQRPPSLRPSQRPSHRPSQRPSQRPSVAPEPFSPTWYLALLVACLAVGALVYFGLR